MSESVTVITSCGEVTLLEKFREYKNNLSCSIILKDDCFNYSFNWFSLATREFDVLWSQIVVVYDNTLSQVGASTQQSVHCEKEAMGEILLKWVVDESIKTISNQQNISEVCRCDTALIYGQRHRVGYKVPALPAVLVPLAPSLAGDWELLGIVQKLN